MCNRYSSTKNEARLNLRIGALQLALTPRYNIAPTQTAPVVLMEDGRPLLRELRWGWQSPHGPVTNARAETAVYKMFRDAWQSRHCLVPADGFYEWKTMPDGKQPYRFVQRDRSLFWFAGLWQEVQFTILTAPAQGCVASMHDRMPIILNEPENEWWLLDSNACGGRDVIQRCAPTERMECYPVTRQMSNARYALPDCVEPIALAQQELLL